MGYRINRLTRSLERRKGANRRFYMEAAAKPKKSSSTTDEHRWTPICSVLPNNVSGGGNVDENRQFENPVPLTHSGKIDPWLRPKG